ncbi:cupin domain-containing protein [Paucibacter sp. APW11]|uniref:Cupin domain-containing protein n=1 Tax=Roseateles aquae TaxID=3077235 RepID=A0ABU3PEI4_9BURK|nr:cupin domain-containing protein [Paucibacter sp. APW11]MDT9000740.1 cupin domain-containing protein [Paucibacter sp. APW11]
MTAPNSPLPIADAPEPLEPALEPLLDASFDYSAAADGLATAAPLRARLLQRLQASKAASAGMVTARAARLPRQALAPGVQRRELYRMPAGRPARPGEPRRAGLISLDAGAVLPSYGDSALQREWLVLQGEVLIDGIALAARDYHVCLPRQASGGISSAAGALLFVRESLQPAAASDQALTVYDAEAGWADFAPGIQRRVLWQQDGQAALLYYAQPGAQVPQHRHGHDEECLMVQGELFLDDVLLQAGDYQLAPAGTGHQITATDTGVVIYAHGDLELQFTG